jgi:hypothetical protein|tara:strand:- start:1172 stop:1309 length:138 start_codon:yes stop_codon:yes gene_type:complete
MLAKRKNTTQQVERELRSLGLIVLIGAIAAALTLSFISDHIWDLF